MTTSASATTDPETRWIYVQPGLGRTGRSLSENNFAKERHDWFSILLREILQNALDARAETASCVEVSLRTTILSTDAKKYIRSIIPAKHIDRFRKSVPHIEEELISATEKCLIIEDFGTIGLTGSLTDPNIDGQGENWNAFWFREGEGGKEATSGNGGAGQGKITYYSASAVRTIFGYTVRRNDLSNALLGSSSFLRDYEYDEKKWRRDAYWGIPTANNLVHPQQGASQIKEFCDLLDIRRKVTEPGLSLVIPSPKEYNPNDAVAIAIAEFFVPIYRGHLAVVIDDVRLDKSTITSIADSVLTDDKAKALHTTTTKGFREFLALAVDRSMSNELEAVSSDAPLSASSFSAETLNKLRSDFQEGKAVSIRIPVFVRPKKGAEVSSSFDVHLISPPNLEKAEQAVIRRDLLIGDEPIGQGKVKQRIRALTLITDHALSRLLLTAEEATHLRWNTRLPRLSEYYKKGEHSVATVRHGAARLLDILTEGDQAPDFKLLAKYFPVPGQLNSKKSAGKKKPGDKSNKPLPEIPPPIPKILTLRATKDGCIVENKKSDPISSDTLPIRAIIEFAYEGIEKDAFNEYDPLDFDISDPSFSVTGSGFNIVERELNRLELLITEQLFNVAVSGFDTNLRLRVRLQYKENADAALDDAE